MSDDRRLGANPLSWVSQEPPDGSRLPGKSAPPADSTASEPEERSSSVGSARPEAEMAAAGEGPAADMGRAEMTPPEEALRGADRPGIFLCAVPETISREELMRKGKIKIKETLDTAQAAAHLEDLAESLVSGVVRAENGEDSVVLCAPESLKFEMKLSRKKGRAKCSIEMEWDDDGSGLDGFRISSDAERDD